MTDQFWKMSWWVSLGEYYSYGGNIVKMKQETSQKEKVLWLGRQSHSFSNPKVIKKGYPGSGMLFKDPKNPCIKGGSFILVYTTINLTVFFFSIILLNL
jgi:hypothetical protein